MQNTPHIDFIKNGWLHKDVKNAYCPWWGGKYLLLGTIIRTSVVNCMAPTPAVSWRAGFLFSCYLFL